MTCELFNHRFHQRVAFGIMCSSLLVPAQLLRAQDAQSLPPIENPKDTSAENILRVGPVEARFAGRASAVYDDNIFISPDKRSDLVWTLAPELTLGLGDYREREGDLLALQYIPSFIFFTDHSDENSIDHEVYLRGQWRPQAWTLSLRQEYQQLSGAVVDVGNRIDRSFYNTDLGARYEISPKTSVEVTGQQTIADYQGARDYNEWVFNAWADYELTPLFKLGAGASLGFVDIEDSANQTYERALVRASYQVTELVELRGSVGAEWRQFQGNNPTETEAILGIGASYYPLPDTEFTLDAYRHPRPSVSLVNQNYILSGVKAGVRHTFQDVYTLTLSGGYENAEYTGTAEGIEATRNDDYFFIRPGIEWEILERLVLGAFYMYRDNSSSVSEFEFNNHQVGITLVYRF